MAARRYGTIDIASLVRGLKSNDPIVIRPSVMGSQLDFQLFAIKSTTEAVWYANPDKYNRPILREQMWTLSVPNPDTHIAAIPIPHTSLTLTEKLPDDLTAIDSRPGQFFRVALVDEGRGSGCITAVDCR